MITTWDHIWKTIIALMIIAITYQAIFHIQSCNTGQPVPSFTNPVLSIRDSLSFLSDTLTITGKLFSAAVAGDLFYTDLISIKDNRKYPCIYPADSVLYAGIYIRTVDHVTTTLKVIERESYYEIIQIIK